MYSVVGVLYKACVGCHRGSEGGDCGFESPYRPYLSRLVRCSLKRSNFCEHNKSSGFLDTNLGFSRKTFFFSKESFFSHVTETNCSVSIFFSKFAKKLPFFRKKRFMLNVSKSLLKFNYEITQFYKFFQLLCVSFLFILNYLEATTANFCNVVC